MTERFEDYNDALNSLLNEAVSCVPASWQKGTLTIESDGTWLEYQLKNDADENRASISDELRRRCENFYATMRNAGDIWVLAVVDFYDKGESWVVKVRFEYPEQNVNETS